MTHVDLFSGIGGFAYAAQTVWGDEYEPLLFCEIDPFCQKALRKHWPAVPIVEDIRDIYRFANEYRDVYGDREVLWCDRHDADFADCACIGCSQFDDEYRGAVELMTGGFPCQDISAMAACQNNISGLSGERSGLWYEYARLISIFKPGWVVIENVANLRNKGLREILVFLTDSGYSAGWQTIQHRQFVGADHARKRIYIVANNQGIRMERLWSEAFKIAQSVDEEILSVCDSNGQWKIEPDFRRIADGISDRMDRLKSLGNAIVPQVAMVLFEAIRECENA